MSTMDSLTALVNALYDVSIDSSLLASKLSSTTLSLEAYLEAFAEFKKNADKTHTLFQTAIRSARNVGVKEEDKENRKENDKGQDEGNVGELEAGPPKKRKLVYYSERVAADVEVRLRTQVVPAIQQSFRAYIDNDVVPDLESQVLLKLKQWMREKDGLITPTLDPPPYNALSASPTQREVDGTPGCKKRSRESALTGPGAEARPDKRERLS